MALLVFFPPVLERLVQQLNVEAARSEVAAYPYTSLRSFPYY